jgi:iron complex transport system substrate-binding protein
LLQIDTFAKKIGMRSLLFCSFFSFLVISCQKKEVSVVDREKMGNSVSYASGLSIEKFSTYSVVKVANPWPNSTADYTYILHQEGAKIPSELQNFTAIQVPIKSIVVTSTTHIPALELLGVETTLKGFSNTNYVSSEKTRALIDQKKVREIGNNQNLNTEVLLEMQPDVLIGFGVDGEQNTYRQLQKNGLNIIYNGDWTEQNPLGRAEWIKLFGVLYGLEEKADVIFKSIEKNYVEAQKLAQKAKVKPTVLCGAIYQDQWFLPQGNSWAALFIKEANGQYLWSETEGMGSLALSFETVLDKAQNADFWIGPGQFTTFDELLKSNPNYAFFKPVQTKKVYSYSAKKGKTGGVIYYELAFSRPDLVLKDMIKIIHPELMSDYELFFLEQLK